eukprot:1300141-Amorphochlora_amoeboformis.AAC.2
MRYDWTGQLGQESTRKLMTREAGPEIGVGGQPPRFVSNVPEYLRHEFSPWYTQLADVSYHLLEHLELKNPFPADGYGVSLPNLPLVSNLLFLFAQNPVNIPDFTGQFPLELCTLIGPYPLHFHSIPLNLLLEFPIDMLISLALSLYGAL